MILFKNIRDNEFELNENFRFPSKYVAIEILMYVLCTNLFNYTYSYLCKILLEIFHNNSEKRSNVDVY